MSQHSSNHNDAIDPTLSDRDLLQLWDAGCELHPLDRALALIETTGGSARADVAALPLGTRDRLLFGISSRLYGPKITLVAHCAGCGREVEVSFNADAAIAVETDERAIVFTHEDRQIGLRRPTSTDLAVALRSDAPRNTLLTSLIDMPAPDRALLDAAEDALAQASGLSDLTLCYGCADCGQNGEAPFDILDYLWRRISQDAQRLLHDIHLLARTYGWSSDEILSLPQTRRNAHLTMATP